MNKIQIQRRHKPTPYEADYAQWCAEQGALLREGRLSDLDRENLAEEIESLGRSDKREIANRLGTLLQHLLKWEFQPEKRKTGWLATIHEQRFRIENLLDESPSLKGYPQKQLGQEFKIARLKAVDETGLRERDFPVDCPYTINQILDHDFFPGIPWSSDKLIRE